MAQELLDGELMPEKFDMAAFDEPGCEEFYTDDIHEGREIPVSPLDFSVRDW